jgi:nicotinamidase-related amidase
MSAQTDPDDIIVDIRGRLPEFTVDRDHLALVCIDMQYLDASPDHGYGAKARAAGTFASLEYYFATLDATVIPNIQRLIAAARQNEVPVVYVRVASRLPDAADTSWRYKQFGLLAPPGSKEREILDELAPAAGDVIVDKTTSGMFNSTNIDQIFRNMGVNSLIITGVATNGCVETSTRGAGDLGYRSYLVSDATATYTPESHAESLRDMDHNFAIVKTTEQVLGEICRAPAR